MKNRKPDHTPATVRMLHRGEKGFMQWCNVVVDAAFSIVEQERNQPSASREAAVAALRERFINGARKAAQERIAKQQRRDGGETA